MSAQYVEKQLYNVEHSGGEKRGPGAVQPGISVRN